MVISVAPNYTAMGEKGRIMAWYNWTNVFVSTKCLILHRTPIPLDIFFKICWICSFQLRWQSMRMPRYLTLFCWLISLPSISMFKELFIFFRWGWNMTKCVLAILRDSLLARKSRTIAWKVFGTLKWLDSTWFYFANNKIGLWALIQLR